MKNEAIAGVLDLTKIDRSGDFPCPRCGNVISPDDCTENAYSILEAKVSNQDLEEIMIRCNRCESELHLTGFSLLQKTMRELLTHQRRQQIMQQSLQKNRSKKPKKSDWDYSEKKNVSSGSYVDHI